MADWKSFKGQTPWTVEHADKPSYNEGDHIATYANAVWLMTEGTNEPITPLHKPCGYWTKNYTPPPTNPPPDGLIAWYPVDEGSGTILYNWAPNGAYKLPNLNIVAQNSNFWTQVPGFGFWDISPIVTQVYATWAAMTPFPTAEGTIIYFAKEGRGVVMSSTNPLYALFGTIVSPWSFFKNHDYYDITIHKAGVDGETVYSAGINFSPRRYDTNFTLVYTCNTSFVSELKVKYVGDSDWTVDAGTEYYDHGFNSGSITGLYMGCWYAFLGVAVETWKGLEGDLMIWNVKLTDAEITQVFTTGFVLNGKTFSAARWGL